MRCESIVCQCQRHQGGAEETQNSHDLIGGIPALTRKSHTDSSFFRGRQRLTLSDPLLLEFRSHGAIDCAASNCHRSSFTVLPETFSRADFQICPRRLLIDSRFLGQLVMTKYNITLDSTGPLITEDIGSWQGNTSNLIAGQPQKLAICPHNLQAHR